MDFLKIFVVELVLFGIYLYALYLDTVNYNKVRKPKKNNEIKLRGENYPFE